MTAWMHRRKGRIVGDEIPQDEPSEWMFVTIHEGVRGLSNCWEAGETVTLRRSLMTLIPEVDVETGATMPE